ncbi:MAG TPA: hypothetical protein VJ204_17155 [Solirubrobacterales bacterium]|nr:hypothetical protein [Solirubrobacterales bacterium]
MADAVDHRGLLELALRPLGALGTAEAFPQDRAGIEALIERLPKGRPSEPKHFAYEDGKGLPRYEAEYTIWLSPAGDGALRVRPQSPWELGFLTIVVHPDGRVGDVEEVEGFGVPDSELTDQARADRDAFERRVREYEEDRPRHNVWIEESQTRFRTENLIRAVAAPPGQHPNGPVVTYLTLYETGLMLNYLVPRPPRQEMWPDDPDDPFAEPHREAMFPGIEIDDGLGTEYEVVDIDSVDMNSSPMRARLSYTPGVPAAAETVRVSFDSVTVAIDLEAR